MPFGGALTVAAIGAGSSAAGGKKANNRAKEQVQIQRDQLNLSNKMFDTGMSAWKPANDYWSALLKGGQPAREAVGPSAALVKETQAGNMKSLMNLPSGGERNLAIANNSTAAYRDLARLYSGVQPQAASMLGQLSGIPLGVGTTVNSSASMMGPSILNYANSQGMQASQGAYGIGGLLQQLSSQKSRGGSNSSVGAKGPTGGASGGGIGWSGGSPIGGLA